jgi:hypothetical protein
VKSKDKDTNSETYQKDLIKRQADRNEYMMQRGEKKNKVQNETRLMNMEFM